MDKHRRLAAWSALLRESSAWRRDRFTSLRDYRYDHRTDRVYTTYHTWWDEQRYGMPVLFVTNEDATDA